MASNAMRSAIMLRKYWMRRDAACSTASILDTGIVDCSGKDCGSGDRGCDAGCFRVVVGDVMTLTEALRAINRARSLSKMSLLVRCLRVLLVVIGVGLV